ncbi:MAG: hypothetical protein NZ583_07300 [Desulfobacterota bacterium]|nr:hypothetical protein [Thermodesulfobacteriota bacterium]MDW8002116.1 hypothetical protein [Deltaproteobacteria bacterium]
MAHSMFFMVGIIHRDREAKDRLEKILKEIKPDIITLEFTNFGLNFRKRNFQRIKRKLAKIYRWGHADAIIEFFSIPYEYEVAKNYSKRTGVPVYFADMDFFSFFHLRSALELLTEKNAEGVRTFSYQERKYTEKKIADAYFSKNLKLFSYSNEMKVRDEYASRLIERIMRENEGKRIVHICGWRHLIDEYGYFSRLNPKKIYVYDKAFCF